MPKFFPPFQKSRVLDFLENDAPSISRYTQHKNQIRPLRDWKRIGRPWGWGSECECGRVCGEAERCMHSKRALEATGVMGH